MSGRLDTELRIDASDELFHELVELHRGLDDEQCRLVDARLILLLANQVGDLAVVREAIARAKEP
jgi:hypothetical protein